MPDYNDDYELPGNEKVKVKRRVDLMADNLGMGSITLSQGTKFDGGKAPLDLLSSRALETIAEVFGFGAKKYGRFNYRNGIEFSRIISSAYRHLGAFNSGEDLDQESGLQHLGHLGCCVIMLLDMVREHPELDNRFKSLTPITEQKTSGNKPPEDIL